MILFGGGASGGLSILTNISMPLGASPLPLPAFKWLLYDPQKPPKVFTKLRFYFSHDRSMKWFCGGKVSAFIAFNFNDVSVYMRSVVSHDLAPPTTLCHTSLLAKVLIVGSRFSEVDVSEDGSFFNLLAEDSSWDRQSLPWAWPSTPKAQDPFWLGSK